MNNMETNDQTSNTPSRMEAKDKGREYPFNSRSGRVWGGVVLLGIGSVLLADKMGADIPNWIFSWPMIPIAIGLFIGAKMNFRPDGWLIPIFIGVAFLVDRMMPEIDLRHFIWPAIIICIGLVMIFRPRRRRKRENYWQNNNNAAYTSSTGTTEDSIDMVSVFGHNKKTVLSKNFKGGECVSFFGGTELNLMQSDFTGVMELELVQVFGGAKLIIPSNWKISSDIVTVFGGLDDKRHLTTEPADPNKVLKLVGASVFGGIEIRSY
jgi:predicted membrane protein